MPELMGIGMIPDAMPLFVLPSDFIRKNFSQVADGEKGGLYIFLPEDIQIALSVGGPVKGQIYLPVIIPIGCINSF